MSGTTELSAELHALSQTLLEIHTHILDEERRSHLGLHGVEGMNRLVNDPAWAWLRSLSSLIADVDHVLASKEPLTTAEVAAVAAQVRGALFGQGDRNDAGFLARYRPLLQANAALASTHGELKRLLDRLPVESENESERLHARHLWAMRCKHRITRPTSRS